MPSFDDEYDRLRIPLEDIVSATNNFADKNLIKRGRSATVYKGKLFWLEKWIDVAVRRFSPVCRLDKVEFLKQIKELSRYTNEYIISTVGFCDQNDENIIVMEHVANGSLDQHLSDQTLTWSQRLQICLGAARAFSHLHVSHRASLGDIGYSKILLDKDWKVKVSCFGLSTRKDGTNVSDFPSFGVILFEVLCGRKSMIPHDGGDQSLAAMAKRHYIQKTLDETIDPNLRKQMHPLSFKIFLEAAYDCLKDQGELRPYMYQIGKRLDDALEVQLKHENIEKNLVHLKIPLSVIESATHNFSELCLMSDQITFYQQWYIAELSHFDSRSSLSIEGSDKGEMPKRRVAIQCISYDKYQGAEQFFADLEIVSSCKHPNIVSLLGFSWEDSQMYLVYEYPFEGSLHDYLQTAEGRTSLTWEKRIRISLDIA